MKISDRMIEKQLEQVKNRRVRARLNKTWNQIIFDEFMTNRHLRGKQSKAVKRFLTSSDMRIVKQAERTINLYEDIKKEQLGMRLAFLKLVNEEANKK